MSWIVFRIIKDRVPGEVLGVRKKQDEHFYTRKQGSYLMRLHCVKRTSEPT